MGYPLTPLLNTEKQAYSLSPGWEMSICMRYVISKLFYVTIQFLTKMEQLIKKDPLTGEEFVAKRSNQRFASAKNKIRYNNRKNAEINKERAFIDFLIRLFKSTSSTLDDY
jgi:hypothetical protein